MTIFMMLIVIVSGIISYTYTGSLIDELYRTITSMVLIIVAMSLMVKSFELIIKKYK